MNAFLGHKAGRFAAGLDFTMLVELSSSKPVFLRLIGMSKVPFSVYKESLLVFGSEFFGIVLVHDLSSRFFGGMSGMSAGNAPSSSIILSTTSLGLRGSSGIRLLYEGFRFSSDGIFPIGLSLC